MIVARHEVPGKSATPKEPSRRVRYDSRPAHRFAEAQRWLRLHGLSGREMPGLGRRPIILYDYGTFGSVDENQDFVRPIMLYFWA